MDAKTEKYLRQGLYEYIQTLCILEAMAKAQHIMVLKKIPKRYHVDLLDNAEVLGTLIEFSKTQISKLNKEVFGTEVITLTNSEHSFESSLRIS